MSLDPNCILFEDHHLIVVNKPAPLLTQAPEGIPSLEAGVKQYIKVKYAKPAGVYLGVPHRLDRPVSGVVLFARNTKAAQRMQLQFEQRAVSKIYWAIVTGTVAAESGCWNDWICKVPNEARVEPARPDDPNTKAAKLEFRVLQTHDGSTLMELKPITGRMHQLRVQTAWRGHAVWGDTQYGSQIPFGVSTTDPREQVIALHARSLSIEHPFTKQPLTFTAPLPSCWPEFARVKQA